MNHPGDTNKMVDTPISDSTPHNVADLGMLCRRLERELNCTQKRTKRLEDWKESALEIEREWNANAIATMLGGKPGESQRKVIQREVPKLLARIKRLEEAGDGLSMWVCPEYKSDPANIALQNWRKAKEDKL